MLIRKLFLALAAVAFVCAPLAVTGCGPSGSGGDDDTDNTESNNDDNNATGSDTGTNNGTTTNNQPPINIGGFWKGVPDEVMAELSGEAKTKAEEFNALVEEWGGEVKEKPDDDTRAHVASDIGRAHEMMREFVALSVWADANDRSLAAGFEGVARAVSRQCGDVVGDRFISVDSRVSWKKCELFAHTEALAKDGRYEDAMNAIGWGELLPEAIVGDDEKARQNYEKAFQKWRIKFADEVLLREAFDARVKELADAGEYRQAADVVTLTPELEAALASISEEDREWAMDNRRRAMTQTIAAKVGVVFAPVETVIYDLRSQLKDKEEAEKQAIIDDVLAQVDQCIAEIDAWGLGPDEAHLFAPPLDFKAEARKKKDSYIEYIDSIRG